MTRARRAAEQSPRRRTASDQVAPALLHAAEKVLDRDGHSGVSIRTVAREADVAPMSVYNRFGSRDGLLVALAARAFAELADALGTPSGLTHEQRFREVCRRYREFALAHPERYGLIFSMGSPVTLPDSDEASTRGKEAFGHLVDAVSALTGRSGDSAVEAAQIVWNALHGAVTIEFAGIHRTEDPHATYEAMTSLLLQGLDRVTGTHS